MTIDYMYNMCMRLEMVSRVDCLVYGFLGCALLTNDHIQLLCLPMVGDYTNS